MDHAFQIPEGFTSDLGIPAYQLCVCGKKWRSDRPRPMTPCTGKKGGHDVSKLKKHTAVSPIAPETHKLDRKALAGLSVISVKRAPGERDVFALGDPHGITWYAEHAYRAITPYGAMRFPTVDAAWAKLSELTGRVRSDRKAFTLTTRPTENEQ